MSLKFDEAYKTYLYIYIFISCCRLLYIFRCTLFYLTKEIHFTYILHCPSYCVKNHISKSSMGFDFGQYRGIATKYETPEIHDLHKSPNLYLIAVHMVCRNYRTLPFMFQYLSHVLLGFGYNLGTTQCFSHLLLLCLHKKLTYCSWKYFGHLCS